MYRFNSILDEDITSIEEALKKYDGIEIGKYKPSNLDLKLIEKVREYEIVILKIFKGKT